MIILNQIKENLIKELKQMNMTQKELSKKLNIAQPVISQYINSNKMPALDTFANLCVILDLDANEVLGITEERKRQN
ncbi:MAG: helix-turn-helix transcriptional regulator [Clostridia bacterium]|nr:helix-turn-helix transcriptional regulator [Clostridia bacterium]